MDRRTWIVPAVALVVGCAGGPSADRSTLPADDGSTKAGVVGNSEASPHGATNRLGDVLVDKHDIAAQGYDVVAYHLEGRPMKGNRRFSAKHNGVRYVFANEAARHRFEAEPDKYLPAYGGYCAFAMATQGRRVAPNPESFKIQDGQLLLFTNGVVDGKPVDALAAWERDPKGLQQQADAHWADAPAD